jgi:archaellum biogenesis ATPase FlaH
MGDQDNKKTIIALLDVLKKIIESADKDKRVNYQNQLNKLGAMNMVLIILSDNQSQVDSDILINILIFANIMIEGGNKNVQQTIF